MDGWWGTRKGGGRTSCKCLGWVIIIKWPSDDDSWNAASRLKLWSIWMHSLHTDYKLISQPSPVQSTSGTLRMDVGHFIITKQDFHEFNDVLRDKLLTCELSVLSLPLTFDENMSEIFDRRLNNYLQRGAAAAATVLCWREGGGGGGSPEGATSAEMCKIRDSKKCGPAVDAILLLLAGWLKEEGGVRNGWDSSYKETRLLVPYHIHIHSRHFFI